MRETQRASETRKAFNTNGLVNNGSHEVGSFKNPQKSMKIDEKKSEISASECPCVQTWRTLAAHSLMCTRWGLKVDPSNLTRTSQEEHVKRRHNIY